MTMTPQEMRGHCERLRARLEEKRGDLVRQDPSYAVRTRVQIDAMVHRVEEIEASLPALRPGAPTG